MTNTKSIAMLVRLPSSHRANDKVSALLGYAPHHWFNWHGPGHYAYLPKEDVDKLVLAKATTLPRRPPEKLNSCWNQPDPFRHTPAKDETCPHKPERIVAWPPDGNALPFYCCECGKFLRTFIPNQIEKRRTP
jgi:hypothetical protein